MESKAVNKMPYKEIESFVVILCFMFKSALGTHNKKWLEGDSDAIEISTIAQIQ